MANDTQALSDARRAKRDEFYTQLSDISNEVRHYRAQLRDKTILCNCDDPYESNFFKYFALNFNAIGLKRLIATSYAGSSIVGGQLPLFAIEGLKPEGREPYAIDVKYVPDHDGKGATDITDVDYLLRHNANTARSLNSDRMYNGGDFRSQECIELLKQADVVVTNPPFSLFREYVSQLVEFNKRFLIIGHQNAITYKEIFPLVKANKLWLGYGFNRNCAHFINKHYEDYATDADHKVGYIRVSGVQWFTNLDTTKRHEEIPLYKRYNPVDYPTYDNFDAIEVSKVADIPIDFHGAIGVPITFLEKYNPEQFEIVGSFNAGAHGEELGATKTETISKGKALMWNGPVVNRNPLFKRIVIRRKVTHEN